MSVAAIILAAGQSSRMGAFKPLLPWGKKAVIDACIKYVRDGGVDRIVVVTGHRADELRTYLATASVTFAINPDPSSEMSDSLKIGLNHIPDSLNAALITPVDYPAVSSSVASTLVAEWRKGSRLVKPTYHSRGGHPVLIDLSLRRELANLSSTNGLKGLFERYQEEVKRIEVDCPYIARDIDTWDDYRALYKEVFGVEPPELPKEYSNENWAGLI